MLQKVETPLSERYTTVCVACGWERQFFGTQHESMASALKMGWEFRGEKNDFWGQVIETRAYCPHCRLLVKP